MVGSVELLYRLLSWWRTVGLITLAILPQYTPDEVLLACCRAIQIASSTAAGLYETSRCTASSARTSLAGRGLGAIDNATTSIQSGGY